MLTILSGIGLYVLGFGLGPLLWAPASEVCLPSPPFLAVTHARRPCRCTAVWVLLPRINVVAELTVGGCRVAADIPRLLDPVHARPTRMLVRKERSNDARLPTPCRDDGLCAVDGRWWWHQVRCVLTPVHIGSDARYTHSDMYAPKDRAFAMSMYTMMPFLGPICGPIIGGAIVEHVDWTKIFLVLFCFALSIASLAVLNMRETVRHNGFYFPHLLQGLSYLQYAPVLLRRRAQRLHLESGGKKYFISKYDIGKKLGLWITIRSNLPRPFSELTTVFFSAPCSQCCSFAVFLFTEPIVTLLAIYIAIEYAILYSLFAAFPIVFQVRHLVSQIVHHSAPAQGHRGWDRIRGGAAYFGVGAGVLLAVSCVRFQAWLYSRAVARSPNGKAPPEA